MIIKGTNLQVIKRLLQEYALAIGRNYHTVDNNPYSWLDDPDIDVEHYAIPDDGYHVKINVIPDNSLSTPLRVFGDEEEGMMYARKEVDRIRTILMNQDDLSY